MIRGTSIFVLLLLSLSYSSFLEREYFRINDSVVIVRSKWGVCGALGIAYHKYDERNRYWYNDHGGPDFELGVMYRDFAFSFYFRPWSLNGNRNVYINGDTVYDYARFNEVKTGFNASYLLCANKKLWFEPLIGLNWTSFYVINEEELKTKFNIPSFYGIHYGTGIHFVPARQLFTFPVVSLWTSFSNADSRRVLPQLGTWYWQTSITFTFKLWGFRYMLLNKNQEQGIM